MKNSRVFLDHELRIATERTLRSMVLLAKDQSFTNRIPKMPISSAIPGTQFKGIPMHTVSGFYNRLYNWTRQFDYCKPGTAVISLHNEISPYNI